MALRRLMSEFKHLCSNPPEGILAGPVSDDNYFEWEAAITGPEGKYVVQGKTLFGLNFLVK